MILGGGQLQLGSCLGTSTLTGRNDLTGLANACSYLQGAHQWMFLVRLHLFTRSTPALVAFRPLPPNSPDFTALHIPQVLAGLGRPGRKRHSGTLNGFFTLHLGILHLLSHCFKVKGRDKLGYQPLKRHTQRNLGVPRSRSL